MKTKLFILALCAFALAGCDVEAPKGRVSINKQPNSSVDYQVRLLFESEGIRVYRFYDKGNYVYFTNVKGHTRYSYNKRTNKVVVKHEAQTANSYTHECGCVCCEKGVKDE